MKKRLLALCMSLCLLVGLLPTAAWAADTQAENASGFCDAEENGESVKWELSPDEDDSSAYTLTISGEGAMADYNSYANTPWYQYAKTNGAIENEKDKDFAKIDKVIVEGGVTRIGKNAFAFTTVTEAQIADSVTSIGSGAFLWDLGLKTISIPASVTNLHVDENGDYYNFLDGTFNLESIQVGDGSPYQVVDGVLIGKVKDSSDLMTIVCPDNLGGGDTTEVDLSGVADLTLVGRTTFGGCRNLKSVHLPDSVEKIEYSSFMKCYSLESFVVPPKVTELEKWTFSGCSSLASVTLNNLETIGAQAFSKIAAAELDNAPHPCSALAEIDLGKVTSIAEGAFQETGLTSVSLGSGSVGANAFMNCEALTSIDLGNVTEIGANAFRGTAVVDLTIPATVTTIGGNAFIDSTALEQVTMSQDHSSKIGHKKVARDGYCIGTRWYQDGTQVQVKTVFDNNPNTEQTFTYMPIYFFDVKYDGVENKTTRFIYNSRTMELLDSWAKLQTVSALGLTVPEGKMFAGWSVAADSNAIVATDGGGLNENPSPEASVLVNTIPTLTLYPVWMTEHSHTLELVDGQAATCTEAGWTNYYQCTFDGCGKYFADDAGVNEIIDLDAWKQGDGKIQMVDHQLAYHEAKTATCTEDGTKAYWECDVCHKLFTDANGQTETTQEALVVPATGHDWSNKDGICKTCQTACDQPHNPGTTCEVCGKVTASTSSGGGGGSSRGNSYAVSTPKADNGSVSVNNGASAKKGETVTITVKPNEGYEIDKVTVTDSKGNSVSVTDKGDGKYSFVMPDSKVDVKATFVKTETKPGKTTFVDVPDNSWYADAADFVAQRGLMSGVGENLFGGNQNTTRAMLMTILARMDGQDVTGGATWYEKAMNWAKQTGVSDGTMPEVNITREQLATMLYSYAKLKGLDTTQGGMAVREFNDYDSISSWAGQSMTWAVNAGILSGRGNNTLAPTAGATRAEMAVMLQQFVGLMEQ